MTLRERALSSVRKAGGLCSIGKLRDGLAPSDLAELDDLLSDISIPSSAIASALRDEGHEVGAYSLARHRRGDCQCR